MIECQSVDGEWGQPCAGCGQLLPNPPRVRSWKSQRALAFTAGASAGMGDRKNAPRVLTHLSDRQEEVIRIVAKHHGNRAAAARELQVSGPSVFHVLKVARQRGIAIPESTRPRRAAV